MLLVLFLKSFRPYQVGVKVIIYTDHSTIKYLSSKRDLKSKLIRSILLFQEF